MKTKVELYTDRKGSNPGGKCSVITPRIEFDAYMKYCPGSKLKKTSIIDKRNPQPFSPVNQPVYEAITLALAKKLGIIIPEFQVLVNDKEVRFQYENGLKNKINENMPYYFVSKLISVPPSQNSEGRNAALAKEKLYRDILMVSDISNKAQNYRYDQEQDRMIYLDLGCSFVNAVGGYLQPTTIKLPRESKQNQKIAKRIVKERWITTADENDLVSLEDLVSVGNLSIPIIGNQSQVPVKTLISEEEISEISDMLLFNLIKIKNKYGKDPRFIKC